MTTTVTEQALTSAGRPAPAVVEVVVPVFNEALQLEESVRRLRRYLDERFPFPASVTIADNASTDGSWAIASGLAAQLPGVRALHVPDKGRGRALKAAWSASDATVVAYMDVDLATDLDALLPLVAPLLSGHSDVATGSRLARGARVVRGPKREVISRLYNVTVHAATGARFSDAQCGFKAVRADVARELLPLVVDDGWFFDTELLLLAERNGLRVHEVPVDWVDDPDSRVDIVATAAGDLKGLWRMSRQLAAGRGRVDAVRPGPDEPGVAYLGRFAGIGGLSTAAYVVVFASLRGPLGSLAANAVALTVCSGANFAAHWRFAVPAGMRRAAGRRFAAVHLGAYVAGLALSSAALAVAVRMSGSIVAALAAVVVALGVASVARFLAVRAVVFRRHLHDGVIAAVPSTSGMDSGS